MMRKDFVIWFLVFISIVVGQESNGNTSTQSSIQIITNNDQKSTGIQTIPTKPHTKSTTEKLPATITQPSTTMKQEASTTVASTSATISNEVIDNCPNLTNVKNLDLLTQEEFSNKLTDSCRYDRLIKPTTKKALDVNIRIDVRHIESADQLQFKSHMLVQLRYRDHRLAYNLLSPKRTFLLGEEALRDKIWVPHIIIKNERNSALMGLDGKDVFVSISPEGDVLYSYRMTSTFYCWMNLQKFPFDVQICELIWVSWTYNASNLILKWEPENPVAIAPNLHLTEFVLDEMWTDNTIVPNLLLADGRFSAVIFRFKLRREVGYYIMDYFLPSILLVCMSWVTFWLQADASAPRVTLGASTMLAFITLNGGLTKNLPKVSYIKASEIWFLGCACFIFCSMAEFAFVNVIWRRKKKVELKKQNSKHILKGALTPSLARKQLRKAESVNSLYKTRSCTSLNENSSKISQQNYLTVHGFTSINVPTITTQSQDELMGSEDSVTTIPIPENGSSPPAQTWTTMTPQEVANWIDKKSRIVFPACFVLYNLLYWSFVYAL
ncbi:pH-sensitive chloride channel 2 isoform X2 [Aethina tumida]|uniref:pH-sensitive chloride channel 2 isoform X2 n=1 Tax=Aethina tumida TaxID=116153 RepID=UPI00096B04CB|nr:pH-sensitive chloride channel 2 isoform X2 [Aethina tumida]